MAERLTKTERLGLIEAARLDANGTASMWDETTMALEATLQALEAEVERHRDAYYEVAYWRDGYTLESEELFDENHGDLDRRTFGSLELARDESQLLESGGYNTRLFRVTRVEVA